MKTAVLVWTLLGLTSLTQVFAQGSGSNRGNPAEFGYNLGALIGTVAAIAGIAFFASTLFRRGDAPASNDRFGRLRALAPIDAVRAWLDNKFEIGDESTLIAAIRKDRRVSLADHDIIAVVLDAKEKGLDAQACLERLVGSK